MGRTTRRREPGEVVNPNRSFKKSSRRSDRKNSRRKLQEIDPKNPESWDDINDDEADEYVKGYN